VVAWAPVWSRIPLPVTSARRNACNFYAECMLLLYDFQNWNVSTNLVKLPNINSSLKSFQQFSSCYMRTDRQTAKRHIFKIGPMLANAPKIIGYCVQYRVIISAQSFIKLSYFRYYFLILFNDTSSASEAVEFRMGE
jgi:hypothetical protein